MSYLQDFKKALVESSIPLQVILNKEAEAERKMAERINKEKLSYTTIFPFTNRKYDAEIALLRYQRNKLDDLKEPYRSILEPRAATGSLETEGGLTNVYGDYDARQTYKTQNCMQGVFQPSYVEWTRDEWSEGSYYPYLLLNISDCLDPSDQAWYIKNVILDQLPTDLVDTFKFVEGETDNKWIFLTVDSHKISASDWYVLACLFRYMQDYGRSMSKMRQLVEQQGFTASQALFFVNLVDNFSAHNGCFLSKLQFGTEQDTYRTIRTSLKLMWSNAFQNHPTIYHKPNYDYQGCYGAMVGHKQEGEPPIKDEENKLAKPNSLDVLIEFEEFIESKKEQREAA